MVTSREARMIGDLPVVAVAWGVEYRIHAVELRDGKLARLYGHRIENGDVLQRDFEPDRVRNWGDAKGALLTAGVDV